MKECTFQQQQQKRCLKEAFDVHWLSLTMNHGDILLSLSSVFENSSEYVFYSQWRRRGFKGIPSKINQSHLIRKGGSLSLSLSLSPFLPLPLPFSSPLFLLASPPPYPTPLKNSNGRNTVYLKLKVPRFLPNKHPCSETAEGSQEVLCTICIVECISVLVCEMAPEACGLMYPW